MNHNKIMNGSAIKRSASVGTLDDGSVQGKRARVASTKKRENTHLDQKPRVGCPFYQKDPITHHKTTSCRGRGFCEMAKLKDHLKDIHRLPKRTIESLNFKGATFNKLRTIEEKWTQVFKILFPKVHHDDIPPPITPICSSDPKSHFLPARSEEPALGEFNLRTFSSNLRYILLKNYGYNLRVYVPQLVDGFEDMFDEALKMTQYPRAWAEEASNKYIESFDGLYMVTQQIDISIGGLQRSVDMSNLPFPTVSVEETDFTEEVSSVMKANPQSKYEIKAPPRFVEPQDLHTRREYVEPSTASHLIPSVGVYATPTQSPENKPMDLCVENNNRTPGRTTSFDSAADFHDPILFPGYFDHSLDGCTTEIPNFFDMDEFEANIESFWNADGTTGYTTQQVVSKISFDVDDLDKPLNEI